MRILTDVLARLKANWTSELEGDAIAEACRDSGMTWNRSLLNPVTTIQVFFLQIVHGNTACEHLSSLARLSFTAAAYCDARMRLHLGALQLLLQRSVQACDDALSDDALWLGKRVFHVDGSSFSMPDTASLQAHFGQPGSQRQGCGFPVAHWLVMMHAETGKIIQMLAAPLRTHEMSGTAQLHPQLQQGDVLVADRGFCSYAHFALLLQRGVDAVLRIHQRTIVDFRPHRPHVHPVFGKSDKKKGVPRSRWLRSLGVKDQLVEWFKPAERPVWMSAEQYAALPPSLTIRELRYRVNRRGFRTKQVTLATTLLDADRYGKADLAELFRRRWEVETNFGHLKTTMKMDVLKCKTPAGVLKELHVFALIYNLVREVMLEAGRKQDVDPHRISFIAALRWLQDARPGDPLRRLTVVPLRPDRVEPRVKKRRPKQYPLMQKPRARLKQELFSQ